MMNSKVMGERYAYQYMMAPETDFEAWKWPNKD